MPTHYASSYGCALNSNITSGGGTDDTTAMQTAIDTLAGVSSPSDHGILIVDGVGLLSDSLVLKSYVTIKCLTNCGFFLANGSNAPMVKTVLSGATISTYDCGLEGGIWNGNQRNQTRWMYNDEDLTWVFGMWIGSVDGFTFQDIEIRDACTFALTLSHAYRVRGDGLTANWTTWQQFGDNSDCIHFWGTCEDVYIQNVYSNGHDDVLALNTTENISFGLTHPTMATWRGLTGGHLKDIRIKNVEIDNCGRTVRLGDGYDENPGENYISNLVLENITGTLRQSAESSTYWMAPQSSIDNLVIIGLNIVNNNPGVWDLRLDDVEYLTLEDITVYQSVSLGEGDEDGIGWTYGNYFNQPLRYPEPITATKTEDSVTLTFTSHVPGARILADFDNQTPTTERTSGEAFAIPVGAATLYYYASDSYYEETVQSLVLTIIRDRTGNTPINIYRRYP